MKIKHVSFIGKAVAIGTLSVSLGLTGLAVHGWANMGSYHLLGSDRYISQTSPTDEPTVTILRPAAISSSKKHLRRQPPLGLTETKRLGVLLIFLGVVAEEES